MSIAEERPKIRHLEIVPVRVQSGQAFMLLDPRRFTTRKMILSQDMVFLALQFDGSRTVREAQTNYVRRFGSLITCDQISQLLQRLDGELLLDNDHFRAHKAKLEHEFSKQSIRRPAHAGSAYEADAEAFSKCWQPRLERAALPTEFRLDSFRPALLVPHYEMSSASESYAAAYRLLSEVDRPQVAVILGIGHGGADVPFAVTRKSFETPFGLLETDPEIIGNLSSAVPFDIYADEFLHRDEHSIEFQAVMLNFIYRSGEQPNIVPILCGGYHFGNGGTIDPAENPAASLFLELLRKLIKNDSRRIAIIASADLSHTGTRFGDPPVNHATLELSARHDKALLAKIQSGDSGGFYQVLAGERDRYRICGFSAIYALLRLLDIKEGHLIDYRQAVEPESQSAVSFAAMGLR